jgi:hypothetical protein
MERPFIDVNKKERKRLQLLVESIRDEELNFQMWEGWTIATALAHLAFWDYRSLMLMQKWENAQVAPSPIDDDVANDALLPLLGAIPSTMAANLAVTAAEAIDLALEQAPDILIDEITKLGDRFRLFRSAHRKMHLDQIENVLNTRRG